MRTVNFITMVTEGPRKARALYNVVDTNEQGATKHLVAVLIDFDELAGLARRAVANDNGEAVLYYGAITATVQG